MPLSYLVRRVVSFVFRTMLLAAPTRIVQSSQPKVADPKTNLDETMPAKGSML